MQKIILSGPTQAQKMLWKVIKCPLWEIVLDEMHHAALNLNQRMAYELEQEHEVCNTYTTYFCIMYILIVYLILHALYSFPFIFKVISDHICV